MLSQRTRSFIRALLHLEDRYGEIVRRTGGSLGPLPCASCNAYEGCQHCCRLRRVMLIVRNETARILDNIRLAHEVPAELGPEQAV